MCLSDHPIPRVFCWLFWGDATPIFLKMKIEIWFWWLEENNSKNEKKKKRERKYISFGLPYLMLLIINFIFHLDLFSWRENLQTKKRNKWTALSDCMQLRFVLSLSSSLRCEHFWLLAQVFYFGKDMDGNMRVHYSDASSSVLWLIDITTVFPCVRK